MSACGNFLKKYVRETIAHFKHILVSEMQGVVFTVQNYFYDIFSENRVKVVYISYARLVIGLRLIVRL